MSGKELFEGMGYIDERFVEEAETKMIPRSKTAQWIPVASMAACLCLILAGAAALGYYGDVSVPQKDSEDQFTSDSILPSEPQLPPVVAEATEHIQIFETPAVILRVDQMTEQGFIGTVAELVDTDLFEIGMELNVIFTEETQNNVVMADAEEFKSQNTGYIGSLISVQFIDYDPESGTILVTLINQIEPGKDD